MNDDEQGWFAFCSHLSGCCSFCNFLNLKKHKLIQFRCRHAPMKKVSCCADSGYANVQLKLVSGAERKCDFCKKLFENHRFSQDDMQREIAACLDAEKIKEADPENVPAPVVSTKGRTRKRRAGDDADDEDEDDDHSQEKALAWLRTLEPTVSLLPAGSFGKKVPLRCHLCISQKWPQGKVLEMSRLRFGSVKNFVTSHFNSGQHKKAASYKSVAVAAEMVECIGMCVSNEEAAGRLYALRVEFDLWATHANIDEYGKHSYYYDKSTSSWMIRAQDCVREFEQSQLDTPPVCQNCKKLAAASSVSCIPMVLRGGGAPVRTNLIL